MPEQSTLTPSDALRQEHNLPNGKKITGHRIVVEGLYLAKPALRDLEGSAKSEKKRYREEFVVSASEHSVHGQGALGHILSDKLLAKRLSEKDPDFRAITTHVVSEHENLFEQEEVEPKQEEVEPKQEEVEPKQEEVEQE